MGGREEFHIDSRYTDLQPLGGGSYGFVVSALDTITGNKVAIKKMTNCVATIEDAKRVAREIKLLRHLDGAGRACRCSTSWSLRPRLTEPIIHRRIHRVQSLRERPRAHHCVGAATQRGAAPILLLASG